MRFAPLLFASAVAFAPAAATTACGDGGGGSGGSGGQAGSSAAAGAAGVGASGSGGSAGSGAGAGSGGTGGNVDGGDASLGGSSGSAGNGGDASTGDGNSSDSAADGSYDGPVSTLCGDGIRDPVTEECDDGPGGGEDACTATCRVHNYFAVAPVLVEAGPKTGSRTLGRGRHPVASGASGSAVTFIEKTGSSHAVKVAFFDSQGKRLGAPVDMGGKPSESAFPGVAALPGGKYVVAWNDLSGIGMRVLMRTVSSGGALGPLVPAAEPSSSSLNADLLWTGSELLVAWRRTFKILTRRFDTNLKALAASQDIAFSQSIAASDVSLTSLNGSWAAVWDDYGAISPEIRLNVGTKNWSVSYVNSGAPYEPPALIALDATHLLVVFTEGTDPLNTGTANVFRLKAAIIDTTTASGSPSSPVTLATTVEPWASDSALSQTRPSLVRSGSRLYLTWQSESPVGDAREDEVWLRELSWNGSALTVLPETPLQADAPRLAAQRNPALAASPLGPFGALVTVWEDATVVPKHSMQPDLVFGLRPTPIVKLPSSVDGGS